MMGQKMTEYQKKNLALLESIDARLEAIEGRFNVPTPTVATPPVVAPSISSPAPSIIEVNGMQAPWVLEALKWDGKNEVDDEDELTAFLGFNPNDDDADGLSWCAGFWVSVLKSLGIPTDGLDLRAISFATFGYDILGSTQGLREIPNGAFLVFQPKAGKRRISHVGVKIDDDKLFGGNQGDSAKRSNLAWYLQNAELVGVRCPNGYKLV